MFKSPAITTPIALTPEQFQAQQLRTWLQENNDHVVLRIGFSKTCSESQLDLPFENFESAEEAMDSLDEGTSGRVKIFSANALEMIWSNYITYCRVITDARWL